MRETEGCGGKREIEGGMEIRLEKKAEAKVRHTKHLKNIERHCRQFG